MKILFISHDAGRTGAPILLLNFMKWLKCNTPIEFDILLLKGGELESEFSELSKLYNWNAPAHEIPNIFIRLLRRITKNFPDHEKDYKTKLIHEFDKNKYNLIYANTVVTTRIIKELYDVLKVPFIIHIHELLSITQYFYTELSYLSEIPSVKFIAVSKLTMQNLVENHLISENKTSIIYGYIEMDKWINKVVTINSSQFIVTCSGFVQIRKNPELFIQIAKSAIKKYPEIPWLFKWIGEIDKDTRYYFESDIKKLNLEKAVLFTGILNNTTEEFNNSDVFLMISREDPFPLVCLEHAALGKPIVCFDKGTGIKEFVEQGAGIVVGYMDIEATVDSLATLYNDKELYNRLSNKAMELVNEYDINIQAGKILSLIEKSIIKNQQ